MGSQLLEDQRPTVDKTYTEIFYEQFPLFLAIGMPSEEYWNGDCTLARYYLRAFKLRQEHQDQLAWLQGAYVHDALTVAIYNGFGRQKNQKALEYPGQPYTMADKVKPQLTEDEKVIEAEAQAEVWMKNFVLMFGGDANGTND